MQGVGGLSEQPWRVRLWAGRLVINKSPHPGLTASTPAPDWEAPAAEAQVPACIQQGSVQVTLRIASQPHCSRSTHTVLHHTHHNFLFSKHSLTNLESVTADVATESVDRQSTGLFPLCGAEICVVELKFCTFLTYANF